MRYLTLLRHAQAESALAGQIDFDRALTRRGTEDAAEMARRLKFLRGRVDRVLSSTAARAFATAEIFARTLKLPHERLTKDDRLYTAGPTEFLTVVRQCDDSDKQLLIVAHNPGITEFADRLSGERRIDSMPTCAFVTLTLSAGSWREVAWQSGVDVELDYPGRPAA